VGDSSGCQSIPSATTTVTVYSIPPTPVITVDGSTDICEHDSVILTSTAGIAYLWSTGDTTQSIAANTEGDFTVQTLNELGCPSLPSDAVSITTRPAPTQPTISFTGNTTFCEGDSLVLTSSAGTTYLWSTGDTTPSITAKLTGTYTVKVGNADGCFSLPSEPVDVYQSPDPPKPVITPAGPIALAPDDSVILVSSSAVTYLWFPGGETTPSITVRTAGSFTVTTGNEYGCLSNPSDPVTVTQSLEKPVITITGDTAFCEGSPATTLTATEASTYLWSNGETSRSILVGVTGSYTVTVFNELGTPSLPSDPVDIDVFRNPVLTLLNKSDASCNGETSGSIEVIATEGTSPYTYEWNNGQTGSDLNNIAAGTYLVTATDANGCQDTLSESILEPSALVIDESITHPTCDDSHDGSVEISISGGTPGYIIQWSNGSTGPLTEKLDPGTINVEVTDENQCQENESYTLVAINEQCITVFEIITPNNDGFNDTWIITGLELYPNATVQVYDRWGKRVYYSEGYPRPWDGTTNDGKVLPMDSYHYIINLNNDQDPIIGNITIVK
jgi:gliding motility-associated-like protein